MNLINLAEKKLDARGEYIGGSDYKIFLDAAGLMQTSFIDYFKKITPELKDKKTGIIVIERVVTELKGLTFNKKSDISTRAKAALDLIKDGIKNGVIVSMESTGGKQKADAIFEAIFTRFRGRYNLALITTDGNLTKSILALNTSDAVDDIKSIRVYQMNNRGYLEQITLKQDSIDDIVGSQIVPFKKSKIPVGEDYYDPINISKVPITGDIVRSEKHLTIKLAKKIASGGEGSIYEFNLIDYKKSPETRTKKYLAKIYHEGIIDKAKVEKIKLIINNKSCQTIKGVCFPISLLYNKNNDPVGYTMK
ncbi:MAG: hypothetical protein HN564_02625, partial [Flavobacteriales bacterium]|nr:hypothetical protein [Flavobacteriales bacterium]